MHETDMKRILVTGSTGYVGREVVSRLTSAGFQLTLGLRTRLTGEGKELHRQVIVGDISGNTNWREALSDCEIVIHLAAQTPGRGVGEEHFRRVNDEATATLVEQAASSGVRLFVFMSSILAVTGNASDEIVTDYSPPMPISAYGRSKLAAERYVADFVCSSRAGVSLRPVMVYGAGAAGNWRLLQKLAASAVPLPFGAVRNRRSLISLSNLADAVVTVALAGEQAASGTFAVADTEPISLSEMLSLLREGMGLPRRLVPVPPALLSAVLHFTSRSKSLLGDLVADSGRFCEAFGWSPPETIRDGIRRSGADYAAVRRQSAFS
jgi:UDP-glucose 4-epimerase